MAVTLVQPLQDRRRSSFRDGKYVHYLLWLVTTDTITDGPAAAILAAGIPTPGSVFIDTAGNLAYLSGKDADPRASSTLHFEVNCEFTTLDPAAPDDNPLHQQPGWAFSYTEGTENYFTDKSPAGTTNAAGQVGPFVVVNSAGDTFEQFKTRERGELQITLTRNEATNDAVGNDAYSHTINTQVVSLDGNEFAVGTLKLSPIAATKQTKTLRTGITVTYYAKTYVLKARHEGWHDMPLDVGFNELTGSTVDNTQSVQPIVDDVGLPVTKPWPLDGLGNAKPNITDAPAVLDFQPYSPAEFTPLNHDWTYSALTPAPY